MKTPRRLGLALLPLLLGGCLEIEQHAPWINGEYDGKADNMHHQVHFRNDKLAWNAAIVNRNHLQNEYNRTRPFERIADNASAQSSNQAQNENNRNRP